MERESQAGRHGLNYTIRSFRSSFRDNDSDFTDSVVALLICSRREEQTFENYRKENPVLDVRESLLSCYTIKKEIRACQNGGRSEKEDISVKQVVPDERVAFRSFAH